jgi:ABC-type molybdate transport system substrate-binding protein
VPLSLAGTAAVTTLDVPALRARALGVRASSRPEAVKAFLDFLAGERGGAAFRTCGRSETR